MTRRVALLVCLALLLVPQTRPGLMAQQAGTLRIYLARHGETDWNVEHKLQGMTDVPLNANGRSQAAALAAMLKTIKVDAVYSSTLSRSRDTAETVAAGRLTVQSLDGLRERNYGRFQGTPDTAPEYVKRATVWDDTMDGGESLAQLFTRTKESLDRVRREHPSGNVLVVGHRITNQMALMALMGFTQEQAVKIEQANDEVYLVELDPGAPPRLWKLIREKNIGDL